MSWHSEASPIGLGGSGTSFMILFAAVEPFVIDSLATNVMGQWWWDDAIGITIAMKRWMTVRESNVKMGSMV